MNIRKTLRTCRSSEQRLGNKEDFFHTCNTHFLLYLVHVVRCVRCYLVADVVKLSQCVWDNLLFQKTSDISSLNMVCESNRRLL